MQLSEAKFSPVYTFGSSGGIAADGCPAGVMADVEEPRAVTANRNLATAESQSTGSPSSSIAIWKRPIISSRCGGRSIALFMLYPRYSSLCFVLATPMDQSEYPRSPARTTGLPA
jgi:hypothetical protein